MRKMKSEKMKWKTLGLFGLLFALGLGFSDLNAGSIDLLQGARRIWLKSGIEFYLNSEDKNHVLVKKVGENYDVDINMSEKFPAASLIKIPVMIASYEKMNEQGNIDEKIEARVLRMTAMSDNRESNWLIRWLGMDYINKVMEKYNIENTRIVENIPSNGKTYRNMTNAQDIADMLEMIYQGKFAFSDKMLYALEQQQRGKDRIRKYLPKDSRIYHKTGTIAGGMYDAGIVDDEIIVVAFDNPNVRKSQKNIVTWARNRKEAIAQISRQVFDSNKERERSLVDDYWGVWR